MGSGLVEVLERSRDLGFLGPGPVEDHIAHSEVFLEALRPLPGGVRVIDLGSGGGVPGLVVATRRPDLKSVLVDAMAKRCRFLEWAVSELAVDARVVEGRAEELGRGPLRGSASAVLARSFGPPAATAECSAPLLRVGGVLVVSEPPGQPDRWPEAQLGELGMVPDRTVQATASAKVILQVEPCPDAYPRRNGVPTKRPLF